METRSKYRANKQKNKLIGIGAITGIIVLILILIGLILHKTDPALFEKQAQDLNVPIENQMPDLPNGCEVTSLSMLLNYYQIKVTKNELAQRIHHVSSYDDNYRGNPNEGFVGYMSQANGGWCVYNKPLYDVALQYTDRIANATGDDFEQIISLVSDGHPVMIITTLKYRPVNDMQRWHTRQGVVRVTPSSHACVIVGYNRPKNYVLVNDPYGIKNKKVDWHNLEASYNQQGKQALYIQ